MQPCKGKGIKLIYIYIYIFERVTFEIANCTKFK